MSKRKSRLLNEKYAILALMRDPHFLAGQRASGVPGNPASAGIEERLRQIDSELERKAKA